MRFTPHRTGDDLRKSTHSYEETTLHQAKCGNSSARHISITKIGQQIEKGRRSPTGVTSRDETSVWRENPKCGVTVVSAYAHLSTLVGGEESGHYVRKGRIFLAVQQTSSWMGYSVRLNAIISRSRRSAESSRTKRAGGVRFGYVDLPRC